MISRNKYTKFGENWHASARYISEHTYIQACTPTISFLRRLVKKDGDELVVQKVGL
jgi:hypothetical protein